MLRDPQHIPAYLFAAGLVVVLVFSGLSVANYLSVVGVHTLTTLQAAAHEAFLGLEPNGTLPVSGVVRLWLNLTVSDPTAHPLVFDTVIYKAWIEDAPREAGIVPRPGDIAVANGSTTQYFLPVFVGTQTTSRAPVPAGSVGTLDIVANLTWTSAGTFSSLQNITEYAAALGQPAGSIAWNVFVYAALDVADMPSPGDTSNPYLTALGRVELEQGVDFGG